MASNGSVNTSDYKNRYLTASWVEKSQSIENNTTTISWTLKGGGSAGGVYFTRNVKLVIAGQTVYTFGGNMSNYIRLGNGTVVASGELTIQHNNDGTKRFDVYVEAGIYVMAVNCAGEATFTLDTIPRASSLTASNGTLDVEQTLTITRAASTFKHRLTYKCGDVAEYIAGSASSYTTATSIKWTPRIGLAAENTTGTSVTVTLTLYTYTSDGTHVGTTTETITCAIPTSVKPSVTISWDDTTGAADIYGAPVQGVSKLKITLTEQTSYGSPISYRSIEANGVKYTAAEATTEALKDAGAQKIAATIKDQRGRSGSNSANLDVLAYDSPVISRLTVHRCNENGTENDQGDFVMVRFNAAVTSLNDRNTATYTLRHKASIDSGFTTETLTDLANVYAVTGHEYIFPADSNNSYDVEVEVEDRHGKHTRATSASTAFTLLNWHASGTGMGVGKVSETENTLEVGLIADFQAPVHGRAYGLGELPRIPDNSDINLYLTPGIWGIRSTESAGTMKNLPSPVAGRLIVAAALGQEEPNSKWRYIEQRFIPYNRGNGNNRTWIQYVTSAGTDDWVYSGWISEALAAYPVGSIIHRYDHLDPHDLFGGTWERISSYILRGATASGTIGETGTLADGSGRSFMNVSIWRRTA